MQLEYLFLLFDCQDNDEADKISEKPNGNDSLTKHRLESWGWMIQLRSPLARPNDAESVIGKELVLLDVLIFKKEIKPEHVLDKINNLVQRFDIVRKIQSERPKK